MKINLFKKDPLSILIKGEEYKEGYEAGKKFWYLQGIEAGKIELQKILIKTKDSETKYGIFSGQIQVKGIGIAYRGIFPDAYTALKEAKKILGNKKLFEESNYRIKPYEMV